MSTKAIREALARARDTAVTDVAIERCDAALAEVEAIEKAAVALVDWTNKGQPRTHLDAARGYDLLERIASQAPQVDTPPE